MVAHPEATCHTAGGLMAKCLNQIFDFTDELYTDATGFFHSTGTKYRETISHPTDYDHPDGWKWICRSKKYGIPSRRGGGASDLDGGYP